MLLIGEAGLTVATITTMPRIIVNGCAPMTTALLAMVLSIAKVPNAVHLALVSARLATVAGSTATGDAAAAWVAGVDTPVAQGHVAAEPSIGHEASPLILSTVVVAVQVPGSTGVATLIHAPFIALWGRGVHGLPAQRPAALGPSTVIDPSQDTRLTVARVVRPPERRGHASQACRLAL
jgi:hypothetical protein